MLSSSSPSPPCNLLFSFLPTRAFPSGVSFFVVVAGVLHLMSVFTVLFLFSFSFSGILHDERRRGRKGECCCGLLPSVSARNLGVTALAHSSILLHHVFKRGPWTERGAAWRNCSGGALPRPFENEPSKKRFTVLLLYASIVVIKHATLAVRGRALQRCRCQPRPSLRQKSVK
jgi:hypothetical protein